MMIYTGAGFIVAVIAFLMLLLSELSVEYYFDDDSYYQTHGWPKLLAFFLAGCLVTLVGRYLDNADAKLYIEKETGKEVIMKKGHSLFFIEVKYWGYILFGLGVVFLFVTTE